MMVTEDKSSGGSNTWTPSTLLSVVAALLGGALALLIIRTLHPVFPYPDLPPVPIQPTDRDMELIQQHIQARGLHYAYNYALEFAVLGGMLGAAFGLITTVTRRLSSALAGLLLAAVGGGVVGLLIGKPVGEAIEQSQGFSLVQAGMFHLPVWSAMAIGLGLGIGFVQAGPAGAVPIALSALVASVLAVALYLVAGSVIFLSDNLGEIIPISLTHQVFWIAICTLVFAVVFSLALRPSKPRVHSASADPSFKETSEDSEPA